MLTQLSTIKSGLGISDTTDDTLLTNFVKFATGRFERECNREFNYGVVVVRELPWRTPERKPGKVWPDCDPPKSI